MLTREELFESDEVTQRLSHLLSVDGYHVVVHPVVHHLVTLRCHSLCYLALMMREDKIHPTSVNVEMAAQILASHCCALTMPPWKSIAPRAWPPHYVLGLRFFPQGEVGLIVLFPHTVERSRCIESVLQ